MHFLQKFRYCPSCGSSLFQRADARSKRCRHCGFTLFLNASAATAAFIYDEQGRLLCTRRAKDPARGTLDLPGGFVDPGETLDQGLRREVLEETGLVVEQAHYLFSVANDYLFSDLNVPTADAYFRCTVLGDAHQARPSDDAASLLWLEREAIRPEDFGLASIRTAVERLLRTTGNY